MLHPISRVWTTFCQRQEQSGVNTRSGNENETRLTDSDCRDKKDLTGNGLASGTPPRRPSSSTFSFVELHYVGCCDFNNCCCSSYVDFCCCSKIGFDLVLKNMAKFVGDENDVKLLGFFWNIIFRCNFCHRPPTNIKALTAA